ncbi:hypothetical protein [Ottowia sp.]|uniref:hypothetical protein n=1 Tax=Ottowia sp. TaxID=1898956 RepID=UPI0025DF3D7F|nr:hypothetical protein [Ottowia sp.]
MAFKERAVSLQQMNDRLRLIAEVQQIGLQSLLSGYLQNPTVWPSSEAQVPGRRVKARSFGLVMGENESP